MEKLDGGSLNVEQIEMEKLKAVFPQCFVEGKLDIDKLLSLCGEYIDNDFEKYKFEWKGKSESLRLAQQRSMGTLRPCPEESVDWDTTQNLYIEGDNLEVLKLLQTAYYRKVKMIYIDPPYNTGHDFVYADDFKDPIKRYKEVTSQTTKSNPETMGRYHTNWLNMMYPRLRLAHNLLTDDGIMFVSISDHEAMNLRKLCDEVFGEENFVADIIWNSTKSVTNTALISVSHTHNLVYFKTKDYYVENRHKFRIPDDGEGFENPDNDPRGPWKADPFQVGGWRPNQQYDIVNPKTGEVYKPNIGSSWKNDYKKYQELLAEDRIVFGKYGDAGPQRKRFLSEALERGKVTKTIWDDVETTTNGTQLLKDLFGLTGLFDNPKPVSLLRRMLELSTQQNDIILDFFSGSATTAHAVMQLNAEDGGNRRFIMVQLPEVTDEKSEAYKAGYKTICEIGKERIRRAGARLMDNGKLIMENEENKQLSLLKEDNSPLSIINSPLENVHSPLDIGFKVFKLDTSNLKTWDATPVDSDDAQQMKLLLDRMNDMVDTIKADRTDSDIVYEVMLKMGVPLDFPVTAVEIGGKKAYSIGEECLLLVCLQEGLTKEIIEQMAEEYLPSKMILSEKCFADDTAMANAHYILKEREIELKLV